MLNSLTDFLSQTTMANNDAETSMGASQQRKYEEKIYGWLHSFFDDSFNW